MILVNCKYPQNSRSYKFCVGCSNRHSCVDSTANSHIPMPDVKPPKNIIPLATEANKITFENIKNCGTQQLQEISKRIENAISTGKFSINDYGNLEPETVEKLRELGYKVESDCTKNESHWSISWQLKI